MFSSLANKAKTAALSSSYGTQATSALASAQNKLVEASGVKCNCDAVDPAKDEAEFNLANNVAWIGWKGNNTGIGDTADPNNKNFAAMLSIKEYHEVSTDALERILQLPFDKFYY